MPNLINMFYLFLIIGRIYFQIPSFEFQIELSALKGPLFPSEVYGYQLKLAQKAQDIFYDLRKASG